MTDSMKKFINYHETCWQCKGSGEITDEKYGTYEPIYFERKCPKCSGSGTIHIVNKIGEK